MGYKVLGFLVWQVGKRYARRKMEDSQRNLAIAGVATAAAVGTVVAVRAASGDD